MLQRRWPKKNQNLNVEGKSAMNTQGSNLPEENVETLVLDNTGSKHLMDMERSNEENIAQKSFVNPAEGQNLHAL